MPEIKIGRLYVIRNAITRDKLSELLKNNFKHVDDVFIVSQVLYFNNKACGVFEYNEPFLVLEKRGAPYEHEYKILQCCNDNIVIGYLGMVDDKNTDDNKCGLLEKQSK